MILLPVFIFFYLYFSKFLFDRQRAISYVQDFLAGIVAASCSLLFQQGISIAAEDGSQWLVVASVTEEVLRFLVLLVIFKHVKSTSSVSEGIFSGIMVGMGFSFAENIAFALKFSPYVVLVRCLSSVPLHIFASGIMAFYVSYANLCQYPRRKLSLLVRALLLPTIYHVVYNLMLFQAGAWLNLVPIVIVSGYILLEGMIEKGRIFFGKDVLEAAGHDADTMEVLVRQKEYERFMFKMQASLDHKLSFWRNRWNLPKTLTGIALLASGLLLSLEKDCQHEITSNLLCRNESMYALVWGLPVAIGSLFIITEKVNFLFLRQLFFRTPRGTVIRIITDDGQEIETIVFEVFPFGFFVPGIFEITAGQPVEARFTHIMRRPVATRAEIRWLNNQKPNIPLGMILYFQGISIRLLLFRGIYFLLKLKRGVKLILGR